MFRTSNPALSSNAFNVNSWDTLSAPSARESQMTVQGVVNKSFFLIGLTTAMAFVTWSFLSTKALSPFVAGMGGGLAALVVSLIILFVPRSAAYLAWVYALLKGAALAGISFIVASLLEAKLASKGMASAGAGTTLVFQAVALTFGIFIALLVAYSARIIRVSGPWKRGIVAATMGLCLFYLASFVLSLVGVNIGFLWDSGPIGIAFSAFVVVLAAANLVLDFQFVEEAAEAGQPKWMEWYAAYGLLVTLAWLYIEVLRLLLKLKDQK